MTVLLDTHVFLWWITGDSRMTSRVVEVLEDPGTECLLSVASLWEMGIKIGLGNIELPSADPERFLLDQIGLNDFKILPIGPEHALAVSRLPHLHRDPFDRLLVSQAVAEDVSLVTRDAAILQYDVKTLW